jgi:hypothetical protein
MSSFKLVKFTGNLSTYLNSGIEIPKNYCVVDTVSYFYYSKHINSKKKMKIRKYRMPLYIVDLNNLKVYDAWKADTLFLHNSSIFSRIDERDVEINRRAELVKDFVLRLISRNIFYFRHSFSGFVEQLYAGSDVHKDIFSLIQSFIL